MWTSTRKVLIISAHADDEAFGMGGTLHKLHQQGNELHWLILTRLWEPRWSNERLQARAKQIQAVAKHASFITVTQWEHPDNSLDQVPFDSLQKQMIRFLDELKPAILFTPGPWDFNFEHRLTFDLVEMSTKPFYSPYIEQIIAYEIPSSTDWALPHRNAFQPNAYVEINDFLPFKKELCALYPDECSTFPHPRSPEGIEVFAKKRGMESGFACAEAFWIARSRWN